MKNKQTQQEKHEQKLAETLTVVFQKSPKIEFEVDPEGIVTVLIKQDHPIQRFFRKLGRRIPQYKRVKLDAMGSFVFTHIDGHRSVKALGNLVEAEFGDKAQPLYQRLLTFLTYIYENCHYIEKVRK